MACGLSLSDAKMMTLLQAEIIAERRIEAIKIQVQTTWEAARFIGFCAAKSMGAKINRPDELIKFEWEREQMLENIDKYKELIERAKREKWFPEILNINGGQ